MYDDGIIGADGAESAPTTVTVGRGINPERRLVAIFAADAADFSRLMSEDEVETLRVLMAHREIMQSLIVRHSGRIANTAGDSVLAEFPSVMDALQCAIAVQERLAAANETLSGDRRLQFRIGIHVGDVMIQGGDMFGYEVNVAARLQAIAEPGGLCLSAEAHAHIREVPRLAFEDRGPQRIKNIDELVRVYSYNTQSRGPAPQTGAPRLPPPGGPVIAVLPFMYMGL